MRIALPPICGLTAMESVLSEHFQNTLHTQESVVLDLSRTDWIAVLPASLLFGWAVILHRNGHRVEILTQDSGNHSAGAQFLARSGFFMALSHAGLTLPPTPSSRVQRVSAFAYFSTPDDFQAYEHALARPPEEHHLLQGGGSIEIIRDGHLKDILLHELGENAFLHANGDTVRFGVFEYSANSRAQPAFLSSFDGSAHLEVVLSDCGPGLTNTLTNMPSNYLPPYPNADKLDTISRKVAWSTEYATTSCPDKRRSRIANILSCTDEISEIIPTGLFYVSLLAKTFSGQLVFRVQNALISIDYSSKPAPRIQRARFPFKIANIPGTHVLVRIPIKQGKAHQLIPQASTPPRSNIAIRSIDLYQIWNDCDENPAHFLSAIESLLQQEYASTSKTIALVANGLPIDTKTFSALLTQLATIPRQSNSLCVLGVKSDLLGAARKIWDAIKHARMRRQTTLNRLFGYDPFLVVSDNLDSFCFGSNSTTSQNCMENDILGVYRTALRQVLSAHISSRKVYHSGGHYLLEGHYYTTGFFEIGRLLSTPGGRHLANAFLITNVLTDPSPTAVFVISQPLYSVAEDTFSGLTNVKWFKAHGSRGLADLAKLAILGPSHKIVVVTDVICTGNEVKQFLLKLHAPTEATVVSFVDGRAEDSGYLTLHKNETPQKVEIRSALRTKIEVINSLPGNDYSKVLVIDPRTHSPTRYDYLMAPGYSDDELVSAVINTDSLFSGHICFHDKHFAHFIFLKRFFESISADITKWWDSTKEELLRMQVPLEEVSVIYLDEQRGWEHLIIQYFSTTKLHSLEPITRENLYAPPEMDKESRKFIWFIIPAIANGETTRECLEFGSRFSPNGIYISVLVARIDSRRLSFYQNITGYRESRKVKIATFAVLPVPAFRSESSCPLCEMRRAIERLASAVAPYPSLDQLISDRLKQLAVVDSKVDLLEAGTLNHLLQRDKDILRIRMLWEEAQRSIEKRKQLVELLEDDARKDKFLKIAGSEFTSTRFEKRKVERAFYHHLDGLRAYINEILRFHWHSLHDINLLFGIHTISQDLLNEHIRAIFRSAIIDTDQTVAKNIVCLALTFPRQYGVKIAHTDVDLQSIDPTLSKLVIDVRQYPYWSGERAGESVQSFLDVLWNLRRSSPWGLGIDNLGMQLNFDDFNRREIEAHLQVVDREGIARILSLIDRIKSPLEGGVDSLWAALPNGGSIADGFVDRLRAVRHRLSTILSRSSIDLRNELSNCLTELEQIGRGLAHELEQMFVHPMDAIREFRRIESVRWSDRNVVATFNMDDNVRGVLFSTVGLVGCLENIMDNAVECGGRHRRTGTQYKIRFSFSSDAIDNKTSYLDISDDLPWDGQDISPSGGLRTIKQQCNRFGALFEICQKASSVSMRIAFRSDEERRRETYV